jgi:hypothetical protein
MDLTYTPIIGLVISDNDSLQKPNRSPSGYHQCYKLVSPKIIDGIEFKYIRKNSQENDRYILYNSLMQRTRLHREVSLSVVRGLMVIDKQFNVTL